MNRFHNLLTARLLPMIAAMSLLIAGACVPERGKNLSDFPDASAGDSLLYYYAQIRAAEYWDKAANDQSLKTPENRRKYIDGVKKGINTIRMSGDNQTYNMGVRDGERMAIRFMEFERRYNVDLDDDILISSLIKGLEDSTDEVPIDLCSDEFYRLLDVMKSRLRVELTPKVQKQLVELARNLQLSKISPRLFYRIEKKGTGSYPKPGETILINIDIKLPDGRELGVPDTERLVMGAPEIPRTFDMALGRLNKGSVGVFTTSADAIFGSRSRIMGVNPEDLLIMTITLNDIIPAINTSTTH